MQKYTIINNISYTENEKVKIYKYYLHISYTLVPDNITRLIYATVKYYMYTDMRRN